MCSLDNNLVDGEILIQRGVRKVYHKNKSNKDMEYDYVIKFPLDVMDRDDYYIDSRGVDSFFQIYFDKNNEYIMYQYDKFGKCYELNNISLDEINKGYIKLSDFLRDAEYVGKKFRRTSPLITYYGIDKDRCEMRDNSYLDMFSLKNIVLYVNDNIFLVKCIDRFEEVYKIIGCNYVMDGNYEFYGNVHEEYRDRNKIYLEILKQIDGFDKKLENMRVRKK